MSTTSIPSSVTLPEDLGKTAVCKHCEKRQAADSDHFFPHRATGGLHLGSRCRSCETSYRAALKGDTARVVKLRPRNRPERVTVTIDATPDQVRDYSASR